MPSFARTSGLCFEFSKTNNIFATFFSFQSDFDEGFANFTNLFKDLAWSPLGSNAWKFLFYFSFPIFLAIVIFSTFYLITSSAPSFTAIFLCIYILNSNNRFMRLHTVITSLKQKRIYITFKIFSFVTLSNRILKCL